VANQVRPTGRCIAILPRHRATATLWSHDVPEAPPILPTLAPPKRLFRLVAGTGPGENPLALAPDRADGLFDDPGAWRSLHLYATRRGALADALATGQGISPGWAMADLRCDDRRPFLDARDPAALPPDLAALAAAGGWRALIERADDAGLAGVAIPVPAAPTQLLFALLDPASARLLAPPKPISPHDPDLRALTRLNHGSHP
jgi:hypothetical protein